MVRRLVLMGSGENSPAMVTPHQNILKDANAYGADAIRLNLETPYGFQENADEMSARLEKYFETNVGAPVRSVRRETSIDELVNEISTAQWLFAGPGSPTYALRKWNNFETIEALKEISERGTIVMASAAAMSLGSYVMPVYEMYKVGEDPHWLPGLNLLEYATGVKAAVVAHFNNTQGGTHDTRFCFVGERRMNQLLDLLPEGQGVLGIDEHTAISFNLDQDTFEVVGKGLITYLYKGEISTFEPKQVHQTSALR